MEQTCLFTAAFGLQPPWEVVAVRFDEKQRLIDFDVAFAKGSRFACPVWCLFSGRA